MNIENNQNDVQQETEILSQTEKNIGERLRQSREQLGLTQQAVAERLCLKTSTIAIIENDAANDDIAPTFLRGYIRAYAKLVKLPEDELSHLLQQHIPEVTASEIPKQNFTIRKHKYRKEGWFSSFTWLILFVVIGLTVAWWWQNHKSQKLANLQPVDGSATQVVNGSQPDNISPEVKTPAATTMSTDESPVSSSALGILEKNAATTHQASVATPLLSPSVNSSSMATLDHQQPGQTGITAADGQLALQFTDNCWVEVIDAKNKVLTKGNRNKGEHLTLAGTPPFKFVIGAPNAVNIQYQGKSVDLSKYAKKAGQVARFTLQ